MDLFYILVLNINAGKVTFLLFVMYNLVVKHPYNNLQLTLKTYNFPVVVNEEYIKEV
jgi:hypothetical protein